MKLRLLAIFQLFLRIYASYVLGLSILLFPGTIWFNQRLIYSIIPPLFSSSILQQNVLDALQIVLFNTSPSTNFIQTEVQHLKDVHVLFVSFYLVGLIALILLLRLKSKVLLKKRNFATAIVVLLFISVVGAIFFSTFFETFHQILFPQGNFAFPADSMLIQTFPPEFWLLQFLELQIIACLSLLFQLRAAE